MTDHPVTTPEPWPDWLADLTPEDRVRKVVRAVAACYGGDSHDQPATQHCSIGVAEMLLSRLLDEARQQAPVPSAGHSQAVAALRRLALGDPMTDDLALADDTGLGAEGEMAAMLSAELAARREHAAGTLETIARLADMPEPSPREPPGGNPAPEVPSEPVMDLLETAWAVIAGAGWSDPESSGYQLSPRLVNWELAAETWRRRYQALVAEYKVAEAGPEPEPPMPEGEWARVEIMGHDSEYGWVTERTRAGVKVLVVSDWDGRVKAEIPGASLYKFVPLPTPQKRPEPQKAIAASSGYGDYEPDDDDPWGSDGDDG